MDPSLSPSQVFKMKELLDEGRKKEVVRFLSPFEPTDIASFFGRISRKNTFQLLEILASEKKVVSVLVEIPEPQLEKILSETQFELLEKILKQSLLEEGVYFVGLLEESLQEKLLKTLPQDTSEKIKEFLKYPEDSVTRIMRQKVFCIESSQSCEEALKKIRQQAQKDSVYYVYCVSEEGVLEGVISLRELVILPPESFLKDVMEKDLHTVHLDSPAEEAARIISKYDYIALPVVNKKRKLVGVIFVDDILDIIQEQARSDVYAQAGLKEDDRIFSSPISSVKKRIPWMLLNLALAGLASSVVSLFEKTMSELIVLASIKNIVAGLGGNTAIQTLTVVTRGLSAGDFSYVSLGKAIFKEVLVGVCIGIITGIGAFGLILLWKKNLMVASTICVSMILNSFVASLAGTLIPLFIKKCNYDPAVGSGVLVTMITDIFSFFSFLGIASLGLHFVGS